ncbi:hypothetical protein [Ravibacter arvi]|uniref:hypothetical protein n=1 Tax=Ravibacter arvi TaxID=2051041 RepID=UPI0031E93589
MFTISTYRLVSLLRVLLNDLLIIVKIQVVVFIAGLENGYRADWSGKKMPFRPEYLPAGCRSVFTFISAIVFRLAWPISTKTLFLRDKLVRCAVLRGEIRYRRELHMVEETNILK